jgi:uncharacterized protein
VFALARDGRIEMGPSSKGTAVDTGASFGIGAVDGDRLAKRRYKILVARNSAKLSTLPMA